MNKDIDLHNVKSVTVTITGEDGIQDTVTLSKDEIADMAKSVMYQTISNAVGFSASRLISKVTCRNLPDNAFFKDLIDGKITEKELRDIRRYSWSDKILVGDDKEYEMKVTDSEFENMKKLALNYIKH